MKRLLAILLIFIASNSFGQTIIDEKRFSMSVKNEIACSCIACDLRIPYLTNLRQDDVRVQINDSLSKIVKQLIESSNELIYFDYYEGPCDTSGMEFAPEEISMSYHIRQNSDRLLSINVTLDWSAGGGGNGFSSTDYFFNVDHFNNEIITVDSLFSSKGKTALQQYVNKNIRRLVNDQSLINIISDSINIFGKTGEEVGLFTFIGFNIDSTSLILSYNRDVGRGIYSFPFKLPLKEILPYFNKKYSWLYFEKKKRN